MRKISNIMMVLAAGMLLAGCEQIRARDKSAPSGPPQPMVAQDQTSPPSQYNKPIQKPDDQDTSAVQQARDWMGKHYRTLDELRRVEKKNHDLEKQNTKLLADSAALRMQLEQTVEELSAANTMLVEMGNELTKWKTNVLGFRKEMRQAQITQMKAIAKVLELLGGEVVPLTAAPPAASEAPSAISAASGKGEPTSAPAQ